MDMTRATFLENDINDDLEPELILTMIYLQNNWPIRAIHDLTPYKLYIHELWKLAYFQMLDFTVYVFLHKEEQILRSEKWVPRLLMKILVGYNVHTVYLIYLKD